MNLSTSQEPIGKTNQKISSIQVIHGRRNDDLSVTSDCGW